MTDPNISIFVKDVPEITYNECIDILIFISTIKPNDKPCYNTKTTIHKNAWFATLQRRWGGEKGEKGIVYINNVLDSCDKYYRMCLNKSGFNNNDILLSALYDSLKGFDNLINTYSDQKTVADSYKNCKDKIIKFLSEVNNTNDNIFDDDDDDDENFYQRYLNTGYNDNDNDNNNISDNKKKVSSISMIASSISSKKKSFFNTNNII